MINLSRILFCVSVLVASSMATTFVAVVETMASQGVLSRDEKNFVTDRLRERAKKVLPSYLGYTIMTRENINAMLPPGKSIEDCEGSCLVETGRNINANYIAQARVGKFGESFALTVELYETKNSELIDSFTAREPKVDALLDVIDNNADSLFGRILQPASVIQSSSSSTSLILGDDGVPSVKIGDQVWMQKNLNVKTPNSWCYDNNSENCEKYGRLYTWNAAVKACPVGWHLPSNDEWRILFNTIGGTDFAGRKLKSKSGWEKGGNGIDSFSFSVLPAGYRYVNGEFGNIGNFADFWSSTEHSSDRAYYWDFHYKCGYVREDNFNKDDAFSIRCVRNSN